MNQRLAIGVAGVSVVGALAALAVVQGLDDESLPVVLTGLLLGGVTLAGAITLGRVVLIAERRRARR